MKLYLMGMLLPVCAWAQLGASPGSLFSASGRLADSTRDLRAGEVGDVVRIAVLDNASAVATGTTNTSRKSSVKNNITSLAGVLAADGPLANLVGLTNAQQIQGQGQTSRNMTLSTVISARVTEVTPNGNLMIEATKDISVNSEKQIITVTGMVRPIDLNAANTIRSDQVADLAIRVNGKGVVGDAIKRPFFLYRILASLLPM